MDETTSLIYLGCNLAKEVEENMQNFATQPEIVLSKCEEIITVFSNVKERLLLHHDAAERNINEGLQEWLRSSRYSAMELLQAHNLSERSALGVHGLPEGHEMGGRERGGSVVFGGDDLQPQPMDVFDSSIGVPLQREQRRRKDDPEKITLSVPAPRMGNTEIPPEDGYTWRKYGQKEILGKRFPRAYYRCTHQKLYQCPAKKQVQRLDEDPYTFEVTYRGDHTCHMSSTAPSMPPSCLTLNQQDAIIQLPPSSSTFLSFTHHWLSMKNQPSSQEGTSSSNVHRDQSVADMADFVFNSGSSSNNSMEHIFSSMEEKWDAGEKKN